MRPIEKAVEREDIEYRAATKRLKGERFELGAITVAAIILFALYAWLTLRHST